jgi:glutathione S-transferase
VPFELKLVDRNTRAHKSADYLKLNPNGLIPVMVDGNLVLYETAAILLHLADTHPEAGLAPALGTPERAQFYKWLMWMTNTLQATLIVYFYPERWVEEGNAAGAAQVKAHAETKIGWMLDLMETHLASHKGKWFLGERFSVLDPLVFLLCRWTRGFARPARSLPRLGVYLKRMLERPAVRRAFETEKLPAPFV